MRIDGLWSKLLDMTTEPDVRLDVTQIVAFWVMEAEEALAVADHLVAKADYSYALFFGHLAVQKMLKAQYVLRKEQHAPPLHNLLRLARAAGLDVDEETAEKLTTVTAFNGVQSGSQVSGLQAVFSADLHA